MPRVSALKHRTPLLALLLLVILTACGDSPLPTANPPESGSTFAPALAAAVVGQPAPELTDAVFFLQPIGNGSARPTSFDASLEDVLRVQICEWSADACVAVLASFTSDGRGPERLRMSQGESHYLGVWTPSGRDGRAGGRIRVQAAVGDLVLTALVMERPRGALPVKLYVENHPVIRAQSLREAGTSATFMAQLLVEEFGADERELAVLLARVGFDADDVATGILGTLPVNSSQLASALVVARFDAEMVAGALSRVMALTGSQIAGAMKDAAFGATDITRGLERAVGLGAGAIAGSLAAVDFPVEIIADALNVVLVLAPGAIAGALRFAQFRPTQVVHALSAALGLSDDDIVGAMQSAGHTLVEIGEGLRDRLGRRAEQVLQAFRASTQLSASDAAEVLRSVFDPTAREAARLLSDVGFPVAEVTVALQQRFNQTAGQLTFILRDELGLPLDQVAALIGTAFSMSPSDVATVFRGLGIQAGQVAAAFASHGADVGGMILANAGYTAIQVGDALRNVYGQAANDAANILRSNGYAPTQIASSLRSVWNLSASQTAGILKDTLGFTQGVIEGALNFAGFSGSEIRNAMEGIFGTVGDVFCGIFGC